MKRPQQYGAIAYIVALTQHRDAVVAAPQSKPTSGVDSIPQLQSRHCSVFVIFVTSTVPSAIDGHNGEIGSVITVTMGNDPSPSLTGRRPATPSIASAVNAPRRIHMFGGSVTGKTPAIDV